MSNKLKELFVPFDIAKRMHDLGFDEMCLGYWYIDGSSSEPYYIARARYQFGEIGAPVWQQAQKWISDTYGTDIEIGSYDVRDDRERQNNEPWHYEVAVTTLENARTHSDYVQSGFVTYTEALQKGIDEALKLIEDGKTTKL